MPLLRSLIRLEFGSTKMLRLRRSNMKFFAPLIVLVFLTGCSVSAWKNTGQSGPWCAPRAQAHVFYRTINSFGMPNPQGEMAFVGKSGFKQNSIEFWHELDKYFGKCTFLNQWPAHGTTDSIPTREIPFDLYLVSMNPTVIVGVERQNPELSALGSVDKWGCPIIGSTYLINYIAVRTNLPYRSGAKIIWFSPAIDLELHQLDLTLGSTSITIDKNEHITVASDGTQLTTLRK